MPSFSECGISPVCWAKGWLAGGVKAVAESVVDMVASAIATATESVLSFMAKALVSIGGANVGASPSVSWLQSNLHWLTSILALISVLAAGGMMIWHQRGSPVRALARSLATVVVFSAAGVTAIDLATTAADQFSSWLLSRSDGMETLAGNMTLFLAAAGGLGAFLIIILGLLSIVGGLILGFHYLSHPFLGYIARSRLREVYTATALMLVVGISALMSLIGLSPALGAFIAGVVLADSEYRHELESTLEPFKGLLLGLFFITVGAGIDFELLFGEFPLILSLTVAVMAVKAGVLYALGKVFRLRGTSLPLFTLALAQAGEFGFVLLSFTVQHGDLPQDTAERLLLVVALSMLLTPLLFIAYDKLLAPRASGDTHSREADTIEEENPIIILGHGRVGQLVDNLLLCCGHHTTVIDYDVETVEGLSRFGVKSYFGDASQPALLAAAGIDKAQLLIIAIDQPEQAVAITEHVRRTHPNLPIIARAYDRIHVYELYQAGATAIIRETFDGAIRVGRTALEMLGMDAAKAKEISEFYYHRDRHGVQQMADAYDPALPRFGN